MIQEARQRLEELLDREIEMARALVSNLDQEKVALTGESSAALDEKLAEKMRLFEGMEKLERQRRELLPNPAAPDLASTVVARWRSLMSLMASCRTANELNGHIIRVRQHQIRQLIDVVRGRPSPLTYDPHGKTFAGALRALAKA